MRPIALVALLLLGSTSCKKSTREAPPSAPGPTAPPVAAREPERGMVDPFARLSAEAQKALVRGYAAQKSKKWEEAQAAFRQVIAQAPDYTPARWQLVRSLALGGAFQAIAPEWEALLQRDFVAYEGKLERPSKELAALRAAPEFAALKAVRDRLRPVYAAGLDGGFCFVARTRPASEPAFAPGATEAALDLKQEVFHYDPAQKRFRRLTDTDGHVFAIDRSPDGKVLAFLVAPRLYREGRDAGRAAPDAFIDPKVGYVELETLTTVGPFVLKGRFPQVMLAAGASGQPIFTAVDPQGAMTAFAVDTARTGLAKRDGAVPPGDETRAWPNQVAHLGKALDRVQITDGANQFAIENAGAPPITVTAARALAQSSLDWSPGKQRLTYAGKLDACQLLKGGDANAAKNELYVYDLGKRTAQRVAAAISPFETLWLDDDRLVYEGGVGKDGQIHLYTFAAHADERLPTRHGAGLYGVPTLACEQAETGVDEDLGDKAEAEGD